MSTKRSGLGRNLSALLGQTNPQLFESSARQELMKVRPETLQAGQFQPRRDFDEQALKELASSIQQQGLLQPLVVREIGPARYEIIAGERRFRACKLAELTEIPVIIRQVDDETAMAMALVENIQREDLNAAEQARAIAKLVEDFDLTHQQVADLLGKSRTAVSNFLRLLSLSDVVMHMLETGDLDMGHARALLPLTQPQQNELAQRIVAQNLSVREAEQWVRRMLHPEHTKKKLKTLPPATPEITRKSEKLAHQLQTKIQVKNQKNGKGSLIIHYNNPPMLERILQELTES